MSRYNKWDNASIWQDGWESAKKTLLRHDPSLLLPEYWHQGIKLSKANLTAIDLVDTALSKADLSGADLSGADLSGAMLRGANLCGAQLRGAVMEGTVLENADLRNADLGHADLSDAVLDGANLTGANVEQTVFSGATVWGTIGLWTFVAGQHEAYFHTSSGLLSIGCMQHTVDSWVERYKVIGQAAGYEDREIWAYGLFIKACATALGKPEDWICQQ